ncbi:MAG: hypothetical protein GDA38_04790 [Hormoscilla sp. SP12CHS1]|nr:hypothetical protein [Hormoscilla sp. SP12CHS1]
MEALEQLIELALMLMGTNTFKNSLLSLERRSLLEKPSQNGNSTVFYLAPVLREYLQNK